MCLFSLALLSCVATALASGQCRATCYKATCDYWDGGYWGTCSSLAATYGCDCSGCMCDGCPQSTCDKPKFDPAKCPKSGSASCDESDNHAECAYDGGDCCRSTCVGSNCGMKGYNCLDPSAPEGESPSNHVEKQPGLNTSIIPASTTRDPALPPLMQVAIPTAQRPANLTTAPTAHGSSTSAPGSSTSSTTTPTTTMKATTTATTTMDALQETSGISPKGSYSQFEVTDRGISTDGSVRASLSRTTLAIFALVLLSSVGHVHN
mmetsp:Transcript_144816/g.255283  ORF Transcript_144816/g.255283 Transcript_144816/m.255283 type:complete len:264 (-) Transcript_144816:225-1016(-)